MKVKCKNKIRINAVKAQLLSVLKTGEGNYTLADLMVATGFPKIAVEEAIEQIIKEYRGHLRVTETGELLYYFPSGINRKPSDSTSYGCHILPELSAIFRRFPGFCLKAGILGLLGGYLIIFLSILCPFLPFLLWIIINGYKENKSIYYYPGIFIGPWFAVPYNPMYAGILYQTGPYYHSNIRKKEKSFTQSVLSYLYGPEDFEQDREKKEIRNILTFIISKKGVLAIEELIALTGWGTEQAQRFLTRLLIEFDGEPSVTEDGTVIYLFPGLLKTRKNNLKSLNPLPQYKTESKKLISRTDNKKAVNIWISIINGINLLFGSYFLYSAIINFIPALKILGQGHRASFPFSFLYRHLQDLFSSLNDNSIEIIAIVILGLIPITFSLFLYLIPLIRNKKIRKKNQAIKQENLRKEIYSHILNNPDSVDLDTIELSGSEAMPKHIERLKEKVLIEIAAAKTFEVEAKDNGQYIYRFPEIKRELMDLVNLRKDINLDRFSIGKIVFDSGKWLRHENLTYRQTHAV
jgi:hypothetical protein